jgi:hypothetical protein
MKLRPAVREVWIALPYVVASVWLATWVCDSWKEALALVLIVVLALLVRESPRLFERSGKTKVTKPTLAASAVPRPQALVGDGKTGFLKRWMSAPKRDWSEPDQFPQPGNVDPAEEELGEAPMMALRAKRDEETAEAFAKGEEGLQYLRKQGEYAL